MTLVESLFIIFAFHQPMGPIPFTVMELPNNQAQVELLKDPPVSLTFDEDMVVVEVNGVEETCDEDEEI